jgi:hypothetical protein
MPRNTHLQRQENLDEKNTASTAAKGTGRRKNQRCRKSYAIHGTPTRKPHLSAQNSMLRRSSKIGYYKRNSHVGLLNEVNMTSTLICKRGEEDSSQNTQVY